MRTSEQIYHRVRWDPRFDPARFVLGVRQRDAEPKRVPFTVFTPGGDIPWHRVLFVEADGEVVWDRETGADRLDESAAGRTRVPRLLREPFFAPRTISPPSRPLPVRPRPAITVLTWNTLWDKYDSERIHTARRRPLLVEELGRADADVIALQEVEPELLRLLGAAEWAGEYWFHSTDADRSALVLLTRLPVREAAFGTLRSRKGVAGLTVDTADRPLIVLNTHLSSDHSQDGAGRRRRELAMIAEALSGVDTPVLLLGDLNEPGDLAARTLGLRDSWTEARGPDDDTPTFDPVVNPLAAVGSLTGRAGRLDRVLVGGSWRVTGAELRGHVPAADGLFASDHYGVRVSLAADARPAGTPPAALDVPVTARTAVAWIPPESLWPSIQDVRREHDPAVDRWPPHVNLLFGFVPEHEFDRAVPLLSEAAAESAPFTARLAGVRSFAHHHGATVWLDPAADGDGPWRRLREALRRRFPGVRDRAEGYTAHLTVGRTDAPARLAADAEARIEPVTAEVGRLVVLSRRGREPMRERAVVELGTGAVTWAAAEASSVDDPSPAEAERAVVAPGTGEVTWTAAEPSTSDGPGRAEVEDAQRIHAAVAAALPDGEVHLVGSRRMGCALAGADVDLVAVLPGPVDAAGIAARLTAASPTIAGLREVTGARVPGLRFHAHGLDVDLVLVDASDDGPDAAVARSAIGDVEAILTLTAGDHERFASLARRVKSWARARGLDSAPFGGVPGIGWTVLAAQVARDGGELRDFFGAAAMRDWTEPLLTPSAPVRSCTEQVSAAMAELIAEELYRAWEGAPPVPMHRRHAAWAVVEVPGEADGRFRGRVRALLTALGEAGSPDAHAWPRPFARLGGGARYAIGLGRTPPDAARLESVAVRWGRGLTGVFVERWGNGDVPTLG